MRASGCMLAAALALALGGAAGPASSQTGLEEEIELMDAASRRESAGELEAAERLLLRVLETRPSSVPALLGLERVLRIQGRLEELPPLVERALREDPGSTLLNRLLVGAYAELDEPDRLQVAAESWIRRVPTLEIAYREVARVWESRGEYGRARAVLEEGRRRSDRPDALALELGDLYMTLSEPVAAAAEWARSIDRDGSGLSQVQRRLRALPHAGPAIREELVGLLTGDPATPGRLDAALELAVDGRLEGPARAIAERRLPGLAPQERRARLDRLARRSDAAGMPGLAHWAYAELLATGAAGGLDEGRAAAVRERRGELALVLGDSAVAAQSIAGRAEVQEEGSPSRPGGASAVRVELLAAQDAPRAREALERFRDANPGSAEVDRLTALVARRFLEEGRELEAATLLTGSPGPRSTVLRARLLLAAGDVAEARRAYFSAAPALRGAEATEALARVRLLGRISPEAGAVVGRALMLRESGRPGEAVDAVTAALGRLEDADAPALLEFAAEIADEAELTDDAVNLRRRLVEAYPRAPEAPPALLWLGRALGGDAGTRAEARELIERLIIEYPRSALVPEARRTLGEWKRDAAS